MEAGLIASVAVCAVAVVALLFAHWRERRAWIAVSKGTASVAFVAVALFAGASGSTYGRVVLAALALSLVGDVALLAPGAGRGFYLGMGAFALAHAAYASAFAMLGVSTAWLVAGVGAAAALAVVVVRVIARRARGSGRVALLAYMVVISVMASMATGAFGAGAPALVVVGAWAFAASDVFVARHRFGTAGLVNKCLGLPLYYGAQVALALSVLVAGTG